MISSYLHGDRLAKALGISVPVRRMAIDIPPDGLIVVYIERAIELQEWEAICKSLEDLPPKIVEVDSLQISEKGEIDARSNADRQSRSNDQST